jgi:hypothetical protein
MRHILTQLSLLATLVAISLPSVTFAQPWPPHTLANTTLRVDYVVGSKMDDPTPPTGLAWGSAAFKYLQDAIDEANLPQTAKPVAIWVRGRHAAIDSPFVYRPDEGASVTPDDPNATFQMANDVRWYGGFKGDEPHTLAGFRSRKPYTYVTVLSGELERPQHCR